MHSFSLFVKLMKRRIPIKLLDFLLDWLENCLSSVKWDGILSPKFKRKLCVGQGSVLSPFLFDNNFDDLTDFWRSSYSNFVTLYADDIILLARSVSELQRMLTVCERHLSWLDKSINYEKAWCMIMIVLW
jgi:Reverse transcriptase (RNA-dependent DNA polymerase)